jgi:hypothetical protein
MILILIIDVIVNVKSKKLLLVPYGSGLAIKNPPNKTQKKTPKKTPHQSGFLVLLGFFKTDICFWCKSHYFSCKMSLEESYLGWN